VARNRHTFLYNEEWNRRILLIVILHTTNPKMVTKCKEGKEKNKNGRCVKKCRDLFERNSAGKCKKVKTQKVKTPPPGYMLNLLTNRFIKKNGPTGKYIISGGPKPRSMGILTPAQEKLVKEMGIEIRHEHLLRQRRINLEAAAARPNRVNGRLVRPRRM